MAVKTKTTKTKKVAPAVKKAPKAAVKKISTKTNGVEVKKRVSKKVNPVMETNLPLENTVDMPTSPFATKWFLIGAGLIVLAVAAYALKSVFIAAIVDGQPVSRLAVVRQLETEYGTQALDAIITQTLIEKEAAKQNITASDAEIDAQMSQIEEQVKQSGQELDQLLAMRGLTREKLREDVRIQQLMEKMAGGDVVVTEEEIATYLSENAEFLPEGKSDEEIKAQVQQQLLSQKRNQKIQGWLEELRQNANIKYLVNY